MSASRIFELSKIFGVPLVWFYDDLQAASCAEMYARIGRHQAGAKIAEESTAEASREALLATYYAQLTPEMRQKLIDIARMLSELAAAAR